jgi:hypothetical protein
MLRAHKEHLRRGATDNVVDLAEGTAVLMVVATSTGHPPVSFNVATVFTCADQISYISGRWAFARRKSASRSADS